MKISNQSKHKIIRGLPFILVVGIFLATLLSSQVASIYALTQAQKDAIKSGARYYNTEDDVSPCEASPSTPLQAGPVYLIGDSIGGQIQTSLSSSYSSRGYEFRANVSDGRTLTQGISDIEQDATFLRSSNVVIIELGTNAGGFSVSSLSQMIEKVRVLAPDSKIYWVDTAVVERDDYANSLSRVNGIIHEQSFPNNYSVISWNKAVFGDNADPSNINPDADDNGYIRHADEYVHLTESGISAMSNLIVSSAIVEDNSTDTVDCACGEGGSISLPGSDNAEQAWNFFRSKGLSDVQTAAILGNFEQESGINPRRVQNTSTPEGDSDINPLDGATGYGIAQWTDLGRQRNLSEFAEANNLPVSSLELQLLFTVHEMTDNSPSDVWDRLIQIQNIREATLYFHDSFEGSADGAEGLNQRVRSAIRYYNLYSGAAPLPDSSPDSPICAPPGQGPGQACTTGDIIGWTMSGPCRMVSYDQADPRWANHPYGNAGRDLAEAGCGPTSVAMVGATLLRDTSITPPRIADQYGRFYIPGVGSSWGLFPQYAQDTGLGFQDLGTDLNAAADVIRRGGLVIISVDGPGYFTGGGHIMVIRAINSDGTLFYLADPGSGGANGERETRGFTADFLRSTGSNAGNMRQLWGYWGGTGNATGIQ